MRALKLDVSQVVPIHGKPAPWSEFLKAIGTQARRKRLMIDEPCRRSVAERALSPTPLPRTPPGRPAPRTPHPLVVVAPEHRGHGNAERQHDQMIAPAAGRNCPTASAAANDAATCPLGNVLT